MPCFGDSCLGATSGILSYGHSVQVKCNSTQAIRADRVVSPPGNLRLDLQPVAHTANRSVCHLVCISSPEQGSLGSGCSGWICLSPNVPDSKCHKQDPQPQLSPNHSHSSGLARHMVFGIWWIYQQRSLCAYLAKQISWLNHSTGACIEIFQTSTSMLGP